MKRGVFNILAALSLLLLLATAGLWVRSYWYKDLLNNATASMYSQQGLIVIQWDKTKWSRLVSGPWEWETRLMPPVNRPFLMEPRWSVLGIEGGPNMSDIWAVTASGHYLVPKHHYFLRLPDWVFCLLELLLPAAWMVRRLRLRLPQSGMCLQCGYDLRASKERCPECGTPVTVAATANADLPPHRFKEPHPR